MENEQAERGMGRLNPSRETKFSSAYGDRGILFFPVHLTTSRIGNLTLLIHTRLYVMTIHTTAKQTIRVCLCVLDINRSGLNHNIPYAVAHPIHVASWTEH